MLSIHPIIADVFPAMPDAAYAELKADIKKHGQREPVWTWQGQLIDGRHRARACDELGRTVQTRQYEGEEVIPFVISLNLRRRHLSDSQRAMVAASIANIKLGDNQHLQQKEGRPIGLPSQGLAEKEGRPIGGTSPSPVSQPEAAELLNVSERNLRRAANVHANGTPKLVEAVKDGQISVSAAAVVAKKPKAEQNAIVAAGNAAKVAAKAKKPGPREAELLRLREANADLQEKVDVLTDDLKAYLAGEENKCVEENKKLRGYIRTVERQRDDFMNQCNEMRREIKALRRKLGQ